MSVSDLDGISEELPTIFNYWYTTSYPDGMGEYVLLGEGDTYTLTGSEVDNQIYLRTAFNDVSTHGNIAIIILRGDRKSTNTPAEFNYTGSPLSNLELIVRQEAYPMIYYTDANGLGSSAPVFYLYHSDELTNPIHIGTDSRDMFSRKLISENRLL